MKINSNITAYITNNSYSQNETRLANSTARLSSGFKLNKSGDDPANFAIASKMRSMIKGLEKVKTNTTTGVSVIQTAEAAMQETQDMIQRMNELSIKASNGTMSSSDRANVQDEVDQLLKEINRIAETTEFNGMKLLNGTFNDRGYTSNLDVSVMDYSDKTSSGKYLISLSKDSDGNYSVSDSSITKPGYGSVKDLFNTADASDLFINVKHFTGDDGTGTDYVTIQGRNGSEVRFKSYTGDALFNGTGTVSLADGSTLATGNVTYNDRFKPGTYFLEDFGITKSGSTYNISETELTNEIFGSPVDLVNNTDGTLTISGANGAKINIDSSTLNVLSDPELSSGATLKIDGTMSFSDMELDLTGRGSMRLQVGTEEGEVISASIPLMTTEAMGLARVDMLTKEGANKAIDQMNEALAYVSSARSRMGAYENRLENTEEYLNAYNEDINTSLSRIQDTDMAEEMTEFTSMQILTQAGISMLAQANEAPQQALQLLQ